MRYVFGPVPSRRLGRSLGVDPVPLKTCDWNCVYCQLGRTADRVVERKVYADIHEMIEEVRQVVSGMPGMIDWITIVGSGEPLLHSGIGELIRRLKETTSLPVAVITNGSLLSSQEVRRSLLEADAVLPTVDAGSEDLFRRLNRPHKDITFERHLLGLVAFRSVYKGKLWPEVMLISGVNDSDEELAAIAEALKKIQPDEIHVNLPVRIPQESWVKPPAPERLERAKAILGEVARIAQLKESPLEINKCDSLPEAIANAVSRHPMSASELEKSMPSRKGADIREALDLLHFTKRVRKVRKGDTVFYCPPGTEYR